MLPPPGPIGALALRAAETPERPFLFHLRGLDWRWLSYREAAGRIGGVAARLGTLPPGVRVGFPATGGLFSYLLDLAVRSTGRIAIPVGPLDSEAARDPELARLGAEAFLALPGFAPSRTVPTLEIPDPFQLSGELPGGEGGVLIEEDGAAWDESPEKVGAAGERFDRAVSAARKRPAREIVVVGPPSRIFIDRAFSDWAVRSGAACLFEPDESARAASAAWGRVSVHAGSAVELAELVGRARSAQRVPFSRSGLPFGRLHTVFPTDGAGLDPAATEAWRSLGVAVG